MHHNDNFGTYLSNGFDGLGDYLENDYKTSWAGNDFRRRSVIDWEWIKLQVLNNNVVCYAVNNFNENVDSHAVLGVGYVNTDKTYIRIASGFSKTLSNFFEYKYTNIDGAWYYRW